MRVYAYSKRNKSMQKNLYKILSVCFVIALVATVATPWNAKAQVAQATITAQIEEGSTGDNVTRLQTFLAGDATIYPQGLITGYFGTLTKAAVIRFQARYGIPQVGRVGPVTLAKINELIVLGGFGSGDPYVAPTIGNIRVDTNTVGQITILWNTNENAQGTVYYSTSPILLTEATGPGVKVGVSGTAAPDGDGMTTNHSVTLSGLAGGVTYYFVIHSVDPQGNESVTVAQTAVTR